MTAFPPSESAPARSTGPREPSLAAQWLGVLLAPLSFVVHLEVGYVLVYRACRYDAAGWLHAAGALAVLVAALGAALAWRVMREAPEGPPAGRGGDARSRARFLGVVGLGVSALLTLLLLAQTAAGFVIDPCQ